MTVLGPPLGLELLQIADEEFRQCVWIEEVALWGGVLSGAASGRVFIDMAWEYQCATLVSPEEYIFLDRSRALWSEQMQQRVAVEMEEAQGLGAMWAEQGVRVRRQFESRCRAFEAQEEVARATVAAGQRAAWADILQSEADSQAAVQYVTASTRLSTPESAAVSSIDARSDSSSDAVAPTLGVQLQCAPTPDPMKALARTPRRRLSSVPPQFEPAPLAPPERVEDRAATQVQKVYRSWRVRRELLSAFRQKEDYIRAQATRLQCAWRAYLARREAKILRLKRAEAQARVAVQYEEDCWWRGAQNTHWTGGEQAVQQWRARMALLEDLRWQLKTCLSDQNWQRFQALEVEEKEWLAIQQAFVAEGLSATCSEGDAMCSASPV